MEEMQGRGFASKLMLQVVSVLEGLKPRIEFDVDYNTGELIVVLNGSLHRINSKVLGPNCILSTTRQFSAMDKASLVILGNDLEKGYRIENGGALVVLKGNSHSTNDQIPIKLHPEKLVSLALMDQAKQMVPGVLL